MGWSEGKVMVQQPSGCFPARLVAPVADVDVEAAERLFPLALDLALIIVGAFVLGLLVGMRL